jgi:hypothetical protein
MVNWYYVDGSDRVGPVSFEHLQNLFHQHQIDIETYVWRKGFANWERIKNVDELDFNPITNGQNIISQDVVETIEDIVEVHEEIHSLDFIEPFSWNHLERDEERFYVKIGHDRIKSGPEVFGPYSVNQILSAISQKRMNEKTLVFTNGFDNWLSIASIPFFKDELGLIALALPINTRDPHYFALQINDQIETFLIKEITHHSAIVHSACQLENQDLIASFFIGMKLIQQDVKLKLSIKNMFNGTYQIRIEDLNNESKIKIDEFNN